MAARGMTGGDKNAAPREVAGHPWTDHEKHTLHQMSAMGRDVHAAVDALPARSLMAVRDMARDFGLKFAPLPVGRRRGVSYPGLRRNVPVPLLQDRPIISCLGCGKSFPSKCRVNNRQCPKCSSNDDVFFGWPG
jgi:hypothetical protein